MKRLRRAFRKWMRRRYGWDGLNGALLLAAIGLVVLSYFGGASYRPAAVLLFMALFRVVSRDRGKRRKENSRFHGFFEPFKRLGARFKNRKRYRYLHCPSCNRLAKVPKGAGKVSIRCPYCHFTYPRRV